MRKDKLEYLNSLKYKIQVTEKNGKFYLFIPELSIVEENENLEQAYIDLNKKKENLFKILVENEFENNLNLPNNSNEKQLFFKKMLRFATKTIIVFTIASFFFLFGTGLLVNKIYHLSPDILITNFTKNVVISFENKFLKISDEARERRILRLKSMVNTIKPYAIELCPILSLKICEKH